MKRLPIITIALTLLAVAIMLGPAAWSAGLQYDRNAVNAGQFWRVITCQWTHWSIDHLIWDSLVFLALGAACERRDRLCFLLTTLASAACVPLVLHLTLPTLTTFRGLSGIDSALFGMLAADQLLIAYDRQNRRAFSWVATAIAGFAIKTTYETITKRTIFVDANDAGFVAIPAAHLAGFLIGFCGALYRRHHVEEVDEDASGNATVTTRHISCPA